MPTPKKVTQDNWYDIWAEWPPADRAAAIKALELTNRQLVKIEALPTPINIKTAIGTGQEVKPQQTITGARDREDPENEARREKP